MGDTGATSAAASVDPATFRDVLGHYPTGVVVVTGMDDDGPVGLVVGTFSSVSLNPPLVAFMPTTTSRSYARLAQVASYCINVLAHDQLDLCRQMAGSGGEKFAGVPWTMSTYGAPVLNDAVAHIHCSPSTVVPAGDHFIVLCEVQALEVTRPVTPLLFFQGGYGGFNPQGMTAKGDAHLITAIRLADPARPFIAELATDLGCEAAVLVAISDEELTTAASSYGGEASMREPLGDRVPLIPPLGEAYIASQPAPVIERWLARAAGGPEVTARYRRLLQTVADRGVALALVPPGDSPAMAAFSQALHDYTTSTLTPARDRSIRAVIQQMSHFYESVDLTADERYDVASVVVPVHSPTGEVSMLVRVTQLPQGASGRQVQAWVDRLRQTARDVEQALAADQATHDLARYRTWFTP